MAMYPLTSEDQCPRCGHTKPSTNSRNCPICADEGCKCDQCPGHDFARRTSSFTVQCVVCGMETQG